MKKNALWVIFMAATTVSLFSQVELSDNSMPCQVTEVARKVVTLKDHKVTYIRIRPPSLPLLPPAPEPRLPTAEEQAAAERMAEKAYAELNLRVTVYLGGAQPVSELSWRDETGERTFRAWSNVDFRYLAQLWQFETATTVYSWFPFVDEIGLSDFPADQPAPIPAGLQFEPGIAEYYLEAGVADLKSEQTTLAGLDHLHAYAQIHAVELKADYERREAESDAREKHLREHPPKTPDSIIHFWPVQSRLNPR